MAIEIVKIEVSVPKELNEIRVALNKVLVDVKAKKPFAEIASGNFPALVAAVEGFEKLDDEVKEKLQESLHCVGLLGGDVAGVLLA